jgi:hypothetical protein
MIAWMDGFDTQSLNKISSASAWSSPQLFQMRLCFVASQVAFSLLGHEVWGDCPERRIFLKP